MEKQRVITFFVTLYFPATVSDTFWGRVMGRRGRHTWLEHLSLGVGFLLPLLMFKAVTLPGHLHVSWLGECSWLSFQAHLKAPWSFSSTGTLP